MYKVNKSLGLSIPTASICNIVTCILRSFQILGGPHVANSSPARSRRIFKARTQCRGSCEDDEGSARDGPNGPKMSCSQAPFNTSSSIGFLQANSESIISTTPGMSFRIVPVLRRTNQAETRLSGGMV